MILRLLCKCVFIEAPTRWLVAALKQKPPLIISGSRLFPDTTFTTSTLRRWTTLTSKPGRWWCWSGSTPPERRPSSGTCSNKTSLESGSDRSLPLIGKFFQILDIIMKKVSLHGLRALWSGVICPICEIMLVSPQAAQLSSHFLLRKISSAASPWETWLRMLYREMEREEKSPAPGGYQTHNLKSIASQVFALPPCYSRCLWSRDGGFKSCPVPAISVKSVFLIGPLKPQ